VFAHEETHTNRLDSRTHRTGGLLPLVEHVSATHCLPYSTILHAAYHTLPVCRHTVRVCVCVWHGAVGVWWSRRMAAYARSSILLHHATRACYWSTDAEHRRARLVPHTSPPPSYLASYLIPQSIVEYASSLLPSHTSYLIPTETYPSYSDHLWLMSFKCQHLCAILFKCNGLQLPS